MVHERPVVKVYSSHCEVQFAYLTVPKATLPVVAGGLTSFVISLLIG